MTIEVQDATASCSAKFHRQALSDPEGSRRDFVHMGLADDGGITFQCRRCLRFVTVGGEIPRDSAYAAENGEG
jgi:hypothetical protein